MRRTFGVFAIVAVAIAAMAAGYVFFIDRPMPPSTLIGEPPFTRTTLQSPDPLESLPPWATTWLVASGCPERVTSGTAYVDLCWTATRQRDEDARQDYYTLEVGGTFGGDARWLVVEAHPLDAGPLLRTEGLPDGRGAGCQSLDFGGAPPPGVAGQAQLCGRLDAGPGAEAGVWHLNWACEPCLPWEQADRPIALQLQVVVEEGTIPNWDLLAGIGR
ncbi:MAG: hypothetical protein ABI620_04160 [Chloroflexota bacterium]